MSTRPGRPVKPSVARAAAKLQQAPPCRLVIDTSREVLAAVRLAAAQKNLTMRRYVLGLLAADGVEAARAELERGEA